VELPLFPLHTVLYPGASLPLHVFEQRYRAMMEHILSGDRRFGVVLIRQGVEAGGFAEVHEVGCVGVLRVLQRADDGTMDIVISGAERFRIERRLPDDPFPRAEISLIVPEPIGPGVEDRLAAARAMMPRYLAVLSAMKGTPIPDLDLEGEPVEVSFRIAALIEVDLNERQRLLACDHAAARLQLAAALARRESLLLGRIGPGAGTPRGEYSPN
jgi:hypothetical protein